MPSAKPIHTTSRVAHLREVNFWGSVVAQCLMIEVFGKRGLKSAIEHVIKSPPLAVPGNPVAALLTRSAKSQN